MTQWDFQNKGTRTSPARLSFVLEVPLRHLRPSVIYSVPCDRILQRAYSCLLLLERKTLVIKGYIKKPRLSALMSGFSEERNSENFQL